MIKNEELFKDKVILAPMDGYTDHPFRIICKRWGVDIVVTEMISADALIFAKEKCKNKLYFTEDERPIGVQVLVKDVDQVERVYEILKELKFDFIDINAGCPSKLVTKSGGGAAILKEPDRLYRIVERFVSISEFPITVKTRLGWDKNSINVIEVAKNLESLGISAISVHVRTKEEMFSGEVHYEYLSELKKVLKIPVVGNGDIKTPEDALFVFEKTGVDSIMIGRAAVGNPWIFKEVKEYLQNGKKNSLQKDKKMIINHALLHLEAMQRFYGMQLGFTFFKKHLAKYLKNFKFAKSFRRELLTTREGLELAEKLKNLIREKG